MEKIVFKQKQRYRYLLNFSTSFTSLTQETTKHTIFGKGRCGQQKVVNSRVWLAITGIHPAAFRLKGRNVGHWPV